MSWLGRDQDSVLVVTRTKHRADKLGRVFGNAGHRVAVIHGDWTLSEHRAALDGFKRGAVRMLVTSDIPARGIDVTNIGHMVNFDLPHCRRTMFTGSGARRAWSHQLRDGCRP